MHKDSNAYFVSTLTTINVLCVEKEFAYCGCHIIAMLLHVWICMAASSVKLLPPTPPGGGEVAHVIAYVFSPSRFYFCGILAELGRG